MKSGISANRDNRDDRVIEAFGEEWSRFPQASLETAERDTIFDDYFAIFPWKELPAGAIGADIGCGSGRWARVVAPMVGELHLVDASEQALEVARSNLAECNNARFLHASVGALPFPDQSLDFAYSLGVLHHVPDTRRALVEIARALKPGAPFLVYLYYALDNRPFWYRCLWRTSDAFRRVISVFPNSLRHLVSDLIAATVYWPLARTARLLLRCGRMPRSWPLAYYRDKSFYTMRTDALDRFGTRLEQRFTRDEISGLLSAAGFCQVEFSQHVPYWVAVARKLEA